MFLSMAIALDLQQPIVFWTTKLEKCVRLSAGGRRDPPFEIEPQWLEVTHSEGTAWGVLFFYSARGSGLWYFTGKTLVVNDIVDLS